MAVPQALLSLISRLAEADRRRHEVMDGRLQLQRHTATKKFVEDMQVKSPVERRVIWHLKRLA
jgi:hypothetical protein